MAYALLREEIHEEGRAPRRRTPAPRSGRRTVTKDRTEEWRGTDAGRDWFAGLDGVT